MSVFFMPLVFDDPIVVPYTNPTGEVDTSNWTSEAGSNFGRYGSGGALGGTQFVMSTNGAFMKNVHDALDIPSAAHTAIDAGEITMKQSVYLNDFSGDSDNQLPFVRFYDAAGGAGTCIGYWTAQDSFYATFNGTWTRQDYSIPVPPGARSWQYGHFGKRLTGTECSAYFSDIQPAIFKDEGTRVEAVYSDNEGALIPNAADGWTESGNTTGFQNTWSPWLFGSHFGGNGASRSSFKDFAVSSLSAACQAAIAAGNATIHLHRYAWNEVGSDRSRTSVFCRASAVTVATAEDAAATTDWNTEISVKSDESVAIPSSTDTIRIQHEHTRADGAFCDSAVGQVYVWITW